MSIRDGYLEKMDRLRARSRKIPLGRRRLIVGAYVFVLLLLILSIQISPFGTLVEAGKPSPRTVLAPKTLQYIDKSRTREERAAAAAAIEGVYTSDLKATARVERQISDLFVAMREADAMPLGPRERAAHVIERTGTSLSQPDVEALLAMPPDARASVQKSATQIAAAVMEERVTPELLDKARGKARATASQATTDASVRSLLAELASDYVSPNASLDVVETDRRRKAAREAVKDVITTRLQGEVVLNKGEMVTNEQVELLKTLGFTRSTFTPLNILHMVVFVLLLFGVASMFLARFRKVYYNSPGLLALMGDVIIAYALVAKVLTVALRSWSPFWGYLMPAVAVTMIIAVLYDTGVAIVIAIICAMITGVVTGGDFSLSAFAMLAGFFPALYISRFSTRHELRRAGLYTSFWVALVAFGVTALTQLNQGLVVNTLVGLLNGAVCTVVALGSLPFLETTFRIATNTWMMELASPEQKLMKELSLKAPGTYSHSVMVANLAEAAAREVGSDPTLARVTAYYHDVGKILRPQFFVENQPEGASMHSGISPNLSTLIITSHVRDGVDMLEANHVPPNLIEIIRQHHGTGIVKFFYERAVEESGGEPVDENRFRYHFEKPKGRTAGILMLADSVEAGARTLQRPSASAIEQTVGRIVDGKLEDGQLDECELTFSDIVKIKRVFTRMLIGSHHPRIDYPQGVTGFEKRNANKFQG